MCVSVQRVDVSEAAYELIANALWKLDVLAVNTLPEDEIWNGRIW